MTKVIDTINAQAQTCLCSLFVTIANVHRQQKLKGMLKLASILTSDVLQHK